MKVNIIKEFIKNPEIYEYVVVGLANAGLVLVLIMIFTSGLGIFYLLSAIIAYEISIIVSFFMHDFWTFGKNEKISHRHTRFIRYNISSMIGLGINLISLGILTHYFNIYYVISEFVAIMITFVFNYIISKKISFKN
jgi:dolichol-phosphate mannosyltransferase